MRTREMRCLGRRSWSDEQGVPARIGVWVSGGGDYIRGRSRMLEGKELCTQRASGVTGVVTRPPSKCAVATGRARLRRVVVGAR
jgi:hypothetical protein